MRVGERDAAEDFVEPAFLGVQFLQAASVRCSATSPTARARSSLAPCLRGKARTVSGDSLITIERSTAET